MEGMVFTPAYKRLAYSILLLAKRDLRNAGLRPQDVEQRENSEDAREFLASRWFEDLCEMTDLNPDVTRQAIAGSDAKHAGSRRNGNSKRHSA